MNKQKRILLLGGNYVQITAIQAALDEGYYVITADYLPDNPGHKLAHEYHNISTIDKEAILALAQEKQIDGIVSYASDVSAPTAAYVAEQLGLPTNPYESVNIFTHKNLFRQFMRENNFPMPKGSTFADKAEALAFYRDLHCTAMLKPIDASGSKGVNKVESEAQFDAAWEDAMNYSIAKQVIVEQFIEKRGYQIDGDIFVVDGEIVFWGICDQHHDMECAPYVPAGLSYPSTQDPAIQQRARELIQRMLHLLHMTMGAYNVEYIVGQDNEVYILEIGPRNGGNFIPDAIKVATGFDMAANTVRQAVGKPCVDAYQMPLRQCCSSYIVHSRADGIFDSLWIAEEMRPRIAKQLLFEQPGARVHRFRNAKFEVGAMLLTFDTPEQMCQMVDNMNEYIQVKVK